METIPGVEPSSSALQAETLPLMLNSHVEEGRVLETQTFLRRPLCLANKSGYLTSLPSVGGLGEIRTHKGKV
jgi:hypothetical protein